MSQSLAYRRSTTGCPVYCGRARRARRLKRTPSRSHAECFRDELLKTGAVIIWLDIGDDLHEDLVVFEPASDAKPHSLGRRPTVGRTSTENTSQSRLRCLVPQRVADLLDRPLANGTSSEQDDTEAKTDGVERHRWFGRPPSRPPRRVLKILTFVEFWNTRFIQRSDDVAEEREREITLKRESPAAGRHHGLGRI
jgi:hypothetical protein